MKKWFFLVLLLPLAFLAWRALSPSAPPTQDSANAEPAMDQYTSGPRLAADKVLQPPKNTALSAECLQFFSDIQRLDLNPVTTNFTTLRLPPGKDCGANPIAKYVNDYRDTCSPFFDPSTPPTEKEWKLCSSGLYFLRAGISSWENSDRALSEITDIGVLADKMSTALSVSLKDPKAAKELVEVSERILELDPRVPGAAKGALVGKFLQGASAGETGKPAFWQSLESDLKRAQELNPGDPQLKDMDLMIQTDGLNPEKTLKLAEGVVAQNRASSSGWELMAYAQWKLNNRELSREALQRALALDPNNRSLQENWKRINEPNANMNSFRRNVNFDLRVK